MALTPRYWMQLFNQQRKSAANLRFLPCKTLVGDGAPPRVRFLFFLIEANLLGAGTRGGDGRKKHKLEGTWQNPRELALFKKVRSQRRYRTPIILLGVPWFGLDAERGGRVWLEGALLHLVLMIESKRSPRQLFEGGMLFIYFFMLVNEHDISDLLHSTFGLVSSAAFCV